MSSRLDDMAKVREAARKEGGEELVAKIDHYNKVEEELHKKIEALLQEVRDGAPEEDKTYALVACTEALSEAYADAAVRYGKANEVDDGQLLVLTIRSISNNLQTSMEERDAQKGGIMGKITGLITKRGPLPKADTEEK